MRDVGIGLIGSGFVSEIHARALAHVPSASLRCVASPTEEHARNFGERYSIPRWYTDFRRVLEDPDVDVVCVGAPNYLHRDVVVAAAKAGKHIICEKPLARTLAEADEMIAEADRADVLLMYAEQLCFAPKYQRAKQLVDEGAIGHLFQVQHGEQHSGPQNRWFWDARTAGGGALMDMGCHSIEFVRWMFDKAPIEQVSAELGTFVHGDRTVVDDHAVGTMRIQGNRIGLVQAGWTRPGGIDDRAELVGSEGLVLADLVRGSALQTYSEVGYGYAAEKATSTRGWTFTTFEELWNFGYPQEMQHFIDCVLSDSEPLESGRDGRAVLEVIYAMYLSAGTGRRVSLPLDIAPDDAARAPIMGWIPDLDQPQRQ